MHCTVQVACGDVISEVLYNKVSEGLQGVYNAGSVVADGPHQCINRIYYPANGYTVGSTPFPQAVGQDNVGSIFHPVEFHKGTTMFSLVTEVSPLFSGLFSGAINYKHEFKNINFFMEGYAPSGSPPTQYLLKVVPGVAGVGETHVAANTKKILRVAGAINANMLPPAGNAWDGRLRIDIIGNTDVLVAGPSFGIYPNFIIPFGGSWYGVLYYQLKFFKTC